MDEEAVKYNVDYSNTVDELAIFPGGNIAMRNFISKNFKLIDEGLTGTIDVSFLVDTDGTVKDVKIKRGVSVAMDKEAKRVVKLFPKFKPGKLKGVPVSTTQTIPIYIYMDGNDGLGSDRVTKVDTKENFENNYKDDTAIKNAKPNEINSYLLSSTQLGLINCDRFLNYENKINYAVNFNNDSDTSVNLIFHSIKSFMSQSTISNSVLFNNIPDGEKITIIAIKFIKDTPYLAVQDDYTSSKLEKRLVFQPVTLESLKSEMKKLDRFN